MSLFNQLIHGGNYPMEKCASDTPSRIKPRTFKETINDQIAFHKSKIADLEAVRDSMTPDVEKFVEAIQRLG